MLTLPLPSAINGDILTAALAAAGLPTTVFIDGNRVVLPGLDATNTVAAQAVLTAHGPIAQAAITAGLAQATNNAALRQAAASALAANRTQSAQNAAIITAAAAVIGFGGSSLTQAQIISTLKDLATGVKILAEHDESNKGQLNALIRLAIGDFTGTN